MVTLIHVPAGVRAAAARRESKTSASAGSGVGEALVRMSTPSGTSPTWSWASLMPGMTTRPPSAISRVARPASRRIAALVPRARTRSPRMATASAHGRAESAVKTLPPVRRRSGAAGRAARRAAWAPASVGPTQRAVPQATMISRIIM